MRIRSDSRHFNSGGWFGELVILLIIGIIAILVLSAIIHFILPIIAAVVVWFKLGLHIALKDWKVNIALYWRFWYGPLLAGVVMALRFSEVKELFLMKWGQ